MSGVNCDRGFFVQTESQFLVCIYTLPRYNPIIMHMDIGAQ